MADALTFEEFVTTRSPVFLRLAYGLTRNHAHAEDLLQTALARTWPAWKRISGDPEPYVRRVLVNTHNSWWRRRWNGEHATAEMPEKATGHPQSTVDDRDEVWRALDRLPKRQRAVLVLRFFEDLSEAQIAQTLGMAPGTVKSYAAKGLAQLRQDPSLLTIPAAPPVDERLTGVRKRIERRRRNRAITVVAVIAALIALLVGSSSIVNRLSLKPEPADRGGLPEYLTGDRIVAGKRTTFAEIDKNDVSFTWTPTTLAANMYTTCDHAIAGRDVFVYLQINGQHFSGSGCDGKGPEEQVRFPLDEKKLRVGEVQVGRPVKVIVGVLPFDGVVPDSGTVTVGIGEPMAWNAFPFPERPARLASLKPERYGNTLGAITHDTGGQRSFTLEENTGYTVYAQSQTPGLLHLRQDDRSVHTLQWWDFKAQTMQYQVGFPPSPSSTLTVVPEHMTGDWIVVVVPTTTLSPGRRT